MSSVETENMIVGLDIGTSKVVAIVGKRKMDGTIEVVGIGSHPSRGLKRGVVVNIETTVQAIQRAVEEAELMAGCRIHSVYAGIAGSHIKSLNSHGIVAIRDREVTQADIDRVIDATHPFARQISRNAATAARDAGIELEICSRPPWVKAVGDDWVEVASLASAVDAIPAKARVLLALGSQHISIFGDRKDCHFVIRMVDPPATGLAFDDYTLITGRPAPDPASEARLMVDHDISHIVCRNSGGQGAYAKITAARKLNLQVIMIRRPDNAPTS